ncbi:Hypothetical predicted protein [Marmota monax]|uniref:Uncharacterized protein n=1 Tax=Marmota monax TaxID=9995 RepID=A0A5E4CQ16_MARMO|nr:Hypothetical predicted protein [Marmota monax]
MAGLEKGIAKILEFLRILLEHVPYSEHLEDKALGPICKGRSPPVDLGSSVISQRLCTLVYTSTNCKAQGLDRGSQSPAKQKRSHSAPRSPAPPRSRPASQSPSHPAPGRPLTERRLVTGAHDAPPRPTNALSPPPSVLLRLSDLAPPPTVDLLRADWSLRCARRLAPPRRRPPLAPAASSGLPELRWSGRKPARCGAISSSLSARLGSAWWPEEAG